MGQVSLIASKKEQLPQWAPGWILPAANSAEGQRFSQLNPHDDSEIIIWDFRNTEQPSAQQEAQALQLELVPHFEHAQLSFVEWAHLLRGATGKEPARIWGELAGQNLVTSEPQAQMLMRVLPELWQPLLSATEEELLFSWRSEAARICRRGWKARLLGRYTGKTIDVPELDDGTKKEIIQQVRKFLTKVEPQKDELFLSAAP